MLTHEKNETKKSHATVPLRSAQVQKGASVSPERLKGLSGYLVALDEPA